MDDFDMFDQDEPSQVPAKVPKFLPTKFKPKAKPKSEAKIEDDTKKQEDTKKEEEQPDLKPPVENRIAKPEPEPSDVKIEVAQVKVEEGEANASMEVDDDEDRVIREIDVFFSPPSIEDNSKLYVLQYPLRPCWRPYEFDDQCEVRVNPASAEVEVDLNLEVDSPNYDDQDSDRIKATKQTLSSFWKPPRRTCYAVGVLIGSQLHLNPIHAVVQLRPSMQRVKYGDPNKKSHTIDDVKVSVKTEEPNEESLVLPKKQSKEKRISNQCNVDDAQKWVALKYCGSESDFRSKYLQKMVAKESSPLQFSMSQYDYMNSLCPGSLSNTGVKGPSRRLLLLPLEERFKTWLREGPPLHRFNALKHLAPNDSVDDVLQVLKQNAWLVQGLWVPRSSLVYEGAQGMEVLARDYILLLFSKNPIIKYSQVDFSKLAKSLKAILTILAIERPSFKDWKLKEPTDVSFIKLYPGVVKEQEQRWADVEEQLVRVVHGSRKSRAVAKNTILPSMLNMPGTSTNSAKGALRSANETTSRMTTMSNETREALPKALKIHFQTYKVCSFQLICQGLRDLADSHKNSPKTDARALVLAAQALEGPAEELQAVINQVATNIHGIYVMKSSTENPGYDLFRNVVINLFCAKGPGAKLRKADFSEAAKIALRREVASNEYNKVLHELCENRHGAWVLKRGDGNPQ